MLCPICFRTLGTWTNDPILTPDGLAGTSYKGFTVPNYIHIQEIQTVLHQLELDNIPTNLTTFSPINNTGNFQISEEHIKELRISIEKLLTATGMTKYQFFNYDENGNYMGTTQTDWNDLNLEKDHYQVRAIDLEDLRHFIEMLWKETWKDLSYNDSVYISGWLPPGQAHSGSIPADNLWIYPNLSVNLNYCGGEATGTIIFSSNFSFFGESIVTIPVTQDPASAFSLYNMNTSVIQGGSIGINTHFQIELGSYSESGTVTGILPTDPVLWAYYYGTIPFPTILPLPPKPYIGISIVMAGVGYITYYIGDYGVYYGGQPPNPPPNGILVGNLTLDRNLYNDFRIFYPSFVGGIVTAIGINIKCQSFGNDNAWYQQPESIHYRYQQTNNCIIGMGSLKLKNNP